MKFGWEFKIQNLQIINLSSYYSNTVFHLHFVIVSSCSYNGDCNGFLDHTHHVFVITLTNAISFPHYFKTKICSDFPAKLLYLLELYQHKSLAPWLLICSPGFSLKKFLQNWLVIVLFKVVTECLMQARSGQLSPIYRAVYITENV